MHQHHGESVCVCMYMCLFMYASKYSMCVATYGCECVSSVPYMCVCITLTESARRI